MSLKEFEEIVGSLDQKKISSEVFWWLTDNINTYIDTYSKNYSLSFMAHEDNMTEMAKLEHLCYQLKPIEVAVGDVKTLEEFIETDPQVKEDSKKQEMINSCMNGVLEEMMCDKENKEKYFKALSYYYEVVGFYKRNPVSKSLDGYVSIDYLSFENIRVPVTKTPMIEIKNDDGEVVDYKRDEANTKVVAEMPPSFCIDFSIDFWENKCEQSLF